MVTRETEVKIRNINKETIIRRLEQIGAKKVFEGRVLDYRFDTPSRTLSKQGKALRIRQKGKLFYLTLKGKKKSFENITSRDEIGIRISNFKIAYRILNELGFIKIFELEKHRTEYRINNCNFDIDEYFGMPPILEIEGKVEEIEKYIEKLKIKKENLGRIYIREILEAKKKYDRKKRNLENNKEKENNNNN